jgi:hypothetical protein
MGCWVAVGLPRYAAFHFVRNLSRVYHPITFCLDDGSRQAYDILCWWNGEDLRFGNGRAETERIVAN